MKGICELCGAKENLTRHHLIPQVRANKKNSDGKTISICSLCHTTIHAKFTESYLRDNLNTIDKLKADASFSEYLEWRKKHLNFKSNSTKRSSRR